MIQHPDRWLRGWLALAASLAASVAAPPAQAGDLKVLAWNDLGMHCLDADYWSSRSCPPFNNLHAQVVDPATASSSRAARSPSRRWPMRPARSTPTRRARPTLDLRPAAVMARAAPNVGLAGWSTASLVPQA